MAALLRHWRKQHTCFWCFFTAAIVVALASAFVGAVISGLYGAVLVGFWGGFIYFAGFMIGVDESHDPQSGEWL